MAAHQMTSRWGPRTYPSISSPRQVHQIPLRRVRRPSSSVRTLQRRQLCWAIIHDARGQPRCHSRRSIATISLMGLCYISLIAQHDHNYLDHLLNILPQLDDLGEQLPDCLFKWFLLHLIRVILWIILCPSRYPSWSEHPICPLWVIKCHQYLMKLSRFGRS